MTGYSVELSYLATKIGQLEAVSAAVLQAASSLEAGGGDLGPGDLNGAVQELADAWRDGIEEIGTRIEEMRGHVSTAMTNYDNVELAGYLSFYGNPDQCPVSDLDALPEVKGGRP